MRSWARALPGRDAGGFTLVEVLGAVAVLLVGVLGVASAFPIAFTSVVASGGESRATALARQQLEVLKNQPFAAVMNANGNDAPVAGFTREWTTVLVEGTAAPNRVVTIAVTVSWRVGTWTRGKRVTLETQRMEWG